MTSLASSQPAGEPNVIPLRALLAVGFVLLTACNDVVTIDEVITESAAVVDDRLIGDWLESDGTDRARIVRGQNKDYAVTYMDKEDTVKIRARQRHDSGLRSGFGPQGPWKRAGSRALLEGRGRLVLHGDPSGMRVAMTQLFQRRGLLAERALYRRVPPR